MNCESVRPQSACVSVRSVWWYKIPIKRMMLDQNKIEEEEDDDESCMIWLECRSKYNIHT